MLTHTSTLRSNNADTVPIYVTREILVSNEVEHKIYYDHICCIAAKI